MTARRKITTEQLIIAGITAFFAVAATVIFTVWSKKTGSADFLSLSFWAAIDITVLFVAALSIASGNVIRDVRRPLECETAKTPTSRLDFLCVFCAFIVWGIFVMLLCGIYKTMVGGGEFFESLEGLMRSLDSNHYLFIAENWYTNNGTLATDVLIVFFPGYPVLVKLLATVIGNYYFAGEILSILFFALSGGFMYLVAGLDGGRERGIKAALYLALIPGVFFFITPMSESLFLFLTLLCVYLIRKKKWLPAALVGCYSAFTRSAGVFVAVIFVYELALDFWQGERSMKRLKKALLRFLYAFIIPVGLVAYLLINKAVTGNAFQFMIYQKQHWNQSLGFVFNTVHYMVDYFLSYVGSGNMSSALGIWVMGLTAIFSLAILFTARGKKLRTSYFIYSLIYFAFSMGTTWLLSAPRYAIGLFTLPMLLGELSEKKTTTILSLIRLAALGVVYLMMFVLRWQVW